jgi:hypothetical protein
MTNQEEGRTKANPGKASAGESPARGCHVHLVADAREELREMREMQELRTFGGRESVAAGSLRPWKYGHHVAGLRGLCGNTNRTIFKRHQRRQS